MTAFLRFQILLISSFIGVLSIDALQAQNDYYNYNDGPYIFQQGDSTDICWIEEGKLIKRSYIADRLIPVGRSQEAPSIEGRDIGYYKMLSNLDVVLDHRVAYDGVSKVAAISDIHGQYDIMLRLLTENHIVDENGNWAYDDGHLVITGDIFDRGDRVINIVWFLIRLEQQASRKGGKVHTLIGNHEWMVLNSDVRYIHKKYRYTSSRFRMPYGELFGDSSYLGDWIRSKPVYVKINDMAFVHGGISEELLDHMPIDSINKFYYQYVLNEPVDADPNDEIANFLKNAYSPLWYRGYAYKGEFDRKRTDQLLEKIDAKRIIVGHSSVPEIVSIHGNKIIFIDASIKLGKKGEMLIVENKKIYRADIWGRRTRLN
jgi:hypothetical protein